MSSDGSSTLIFDPASRAALARRVTQRSLVEFAEILRVKVARKRGFTCLIAGDSELLRLNKQFRKKRYPADVLSFPSDSLKGELGEMAISADRAFDQAAEFGHGVGDELRILMLHGVLHLLGFDHETDNGAMARVEARWRKTLGLPLSLTERVRA